MKTTVEGIGVVIVNEEGDYISFDDCDTPNTISSILEKAGAESVHSHLEHALNSIGDKHYSQELGGRSAKKTVEAYRAETGRQYPKVYRIKVSVEIEELPDAESDAFWERQRYSNG